MQMHPLTATYLIAAIVLIGILINAMYQTWAPHGLVYKRVAIVERDDTKPAKPELTVRLASDYLAPVRLDAPDDVHPEASFVCVAITGSLDDRKAKAKFATLDKCPLPVTRQLPQSGVKTVTERSGNKTFRSMTFGDNAGTTSDSQPFPSRGITISR